MNVEVTLRSWIGDHAAGPDEQPGALLVEGIRVDGHDLTEIARPDMRIHGYDGADPVALPAATLDLDGFLAVRITPIPEELRYLRDDPNQHLLGTTDEVLVLPVSSLTVHELSTSAA